MHRKRKAPLTPRQAIALARRSLKFRTWYAATSVYIPTKDDSSTGVENEKHFNLSELAAMWGLSVETIRKLFADDPGVVKMPSASGPKGRRRYRIFRIPSSAAARLHKRLSA
ncbi:MAG TPA: hypothetical protein VNO32_13700 [Candidatus Acidoferrum sp.]|jgi:hypothetical protein|nr:hypothetical protein [Candidatus Acidoferrum sp.]